MVQWFALPIAPNEDFDGAPLLRTEFVLDEGHGPVVRATLYATAQGIFQAYLNGQPVSEDVLSPGWSSYEWRLRYRSYDVTSLIEPKSVLGIALGNGWFRGRLGWAEAGPTTARSLSPWCSSRSSSPMVMSKAWSPMKLDRRPLGGGIQRPLRRTDHRRATPFGRLVGTGFLR